MKYAAWRYYLGFYQGSYRRLAISMVVSIGQAFLILPVAWLVRYAFDQAIPAGDTGQIAWIGAGMIVLYLLLSLSQSWAKYEMGQVTRVVIQRMRTALVNEVLWLPRAYYSQADWSKLQSVLVLESERVSRMSEAIIINLVPALCISLVLSAFLLYQALSLFLLLAVSLPVLFGLNRISRFHVNEWAKNFQRDYTAFNRGVAAAIQQLELTHLQTAESQQMAAQQRLINTAGETTRKFAWHKAVHSIVEENIILVSSVLVLIAGGIAVAAHTMSIGHLLAFYAGVALLKPHLQTVSATILPIIEGYTALDALYQQHVSFPAPPYSGKHLAQLAGPLEFQNVSFQYKDTRVLNDVCLMLPPGKLTAIVGENGSGKSTLAYLLLGFYRPQGGRITVGGQALDELDIHRLRQQIGVVPQEAALFSASILENITYGRPDATLEEVTAAAELATAHEFIQELPAGYQTPVGEKGMLLSGGQRQRISLARALLRQPRLLILDEPINHLDEQSARRVIQNIRSLPTPPTILLITHDRQLALDADQAFRLQAGYLVAFSSEMDAI